MILPDFLSIAELVGPPAFGADQAMVLTQWSQSWTDLLNESQTVTAAVAAATAAAAVVFLFQDVRKDASVALAHFIGHVDDVRHRRLWNFFGCLKLYKTIT